MTYLINPCQRAGGTLNPPGDKSISHRAIIISSIAKGKTTVKNFSLSQDCKATLVAFNSLGVKIKQIGKDSLIVYGVGKNGLKKPKHPLNLRGSGTTMRILIGLLSAQSFDSKLIAEKSLQKRPMHRVIEPLKLMGANIKARKINQEEYPPISISPSKLLPIKFKMNIPSAQVKSAILLAGLYAKGMTKIYEPHKSRDHTERMLKYFGAEIKIKEKNIYIKPSNLISPKKVIIPADISSAAFFIVLACLLKNSHIKIKNLCLNPSRCGVIDVLKKMGADIRIINRKNQYFEPMADVIVKSSKLNCIVINEGEIPSLIDELPILMVAASLAKGKSVFRGIQELRVKETDRINSMVNNLLRMGVKIKTRLKAKKEIVEIYGTKNLKGAQLKSFGDHRTAMSMVIAALLADSPSRIDDIKCISKSFPDFFKTLNQIIQ